MLVILFVWIARCFHNTCGLGYLENSSLVSNTESVLIKAILTRIQSHGSIYSRPVTQANHTLDVLLDLTPIHILDFNEKSQVLTTMVWKSMKWRDENIAWDPDQYDGVKHVNLPPDSVWKPDIVLYNRVEAIGETSLQHWITIYHDGTVLLVPAVVYTSVCLVNMENFPYDTQRCQLKFGSWAFTEDKLNLTLNPENGGLDMSQFTASMEWELAGVKVERHALKYKCCTEKYVDVVYELVLSRNSAFYTRFLILPVILLSILVPVIFWIPPSRPDRTGLGMSLFGSFMLLLLIIVEISPPSKNIRLISYCCANIILTATVTIISAGIVNISQKKEPVPQCLATMYHLKIETNHEAKGQIGSVSESIEGSSKLNKPPLRANVPPSHKWMEVALTTDRICFVIYLILSIIMLVFYLPKPI